jgi:hypothetical protein
MRFSIAAIFLSASMVCGSIMKKARRLDQSTSGEFDFLVDYNLKVLACSSDLSYSSSTHGYGSESSTIIFRLCPTSGECSNDVGKSCTAGYGDYVVGTITFVQAYLQQTREEMQGDDAFQLEQLGKCSQYKADPDGDYAEGLFYVGPACTSDGTGVRMALFSDQDCSTEEKAVTFEDISAGRSLPYSDGGLVSQYCESCYSANNNDEAGVNNFCWDVFDQSIIRCETKMEIFQYSSWGENNCEYISELLTSSRRESTRSGNGGTVVGWLFFSMVVCGLVGFVFTAMKKKESDKESDNNFGLMT